MLCLWLFALKAGPVKDLAFMLSLWLFALKAGPMKDLASAMSVAVCPLLRD